MYLDLRITASDSDYEGHLDVALGIGYGSDIRGLVAKDANEVERFITSNLPVLVKLALIRAEAEDAREAAERAAEAANADAE